MTNRRAQVGEGISFGPFRLIAGERLLTKDGSPVNLGGRALDILIALASRPSAVVGKEELLARVWPDVTVGEDSLRFHIATLRKALGDGRNGARYITTLPGRGYCFVAPISRSGDNGPMGTATAAAFPHANLPGCLIRMIGREEDVLRLSAHLTSVRFVTIVGVGGVGKTTVAVAVGHHLFESFAGAVLLVDLGMLSDPDLVATAVASMLGLSVQSGDAIPSLLAHLRDKRILMILDTCEHFVDAVAILASRLFEAAPQVHILATSREALQVEGEHVYKLDPLACPPDDDPGLTVALAQSYPAAQLFVERAVASGARFLLGESDVAVVTSICRKLDGLPLAIELAARHVESYGLQQTAVLLDRSLTLLWSGSRTAPPRQRTLQAMLDWSYGLLSQAERVVIRRLAVFVGHFTLDAALAVATSATIDQSAVFSAFDSLVAKSLIATYPIGAMMRYRLLDTTRAFALGIKVSDAEFADLAVRHASYYRRWLEQNGPEWSTLSTGEERAPYFAALNNVRAALEWCFGPGGDSNGFGVGLAAAAAPVFLMMSLLPECQRWSERALQALDDAARGGFEELHLQAALGVSLMFTRGGNDAAHVALDRGLTIAEERGGALDQMQLLGPLHLFNVRTGSFHGALRCARRCSALAETIEDAVAGALAHSLLGMSLHFSGDLGDARMELEAALQQAPGSRRTTIFSLGLDVRVLAGAILARTLWLQGHPDQAAARARMTVEAAAAMGHPLTFCIAVIWAVSVFLWTGDLRGAAEHTDRLMSCAESHSFAPYLAVGCGFRGELAIRQGNPTGGVESLRTCLKELHAAPYELLTTAFNISLAQGLGATGQFAEGMVLIDETMRAAEAHGDLCYGPELLRVKSSLLGFMPPPSCEEAKSCLMRSLELSRRQGARAWELRTAVALAALLAGQRRSESARALLRPVMEQFDEGFDTADLELAKCLLGTLV